MLLSAQRWPSKNMGCYDTVTFRCPRCDATLEVQSKAGESDMAYFNETDVPVVIAKAIDGEELWCTACDRKWRVTRLVKIDTVPMGLIRG